MLKCMGLGGGGGGGIGRKKELLLLIPFLDIKPSWFIYPQNFVQEILIGDQGILVT